MAQTLDPSRIIQAGFGFWSSKVLLSAVKLELFTVLGSRAMTGVELGKALGLHPRGIWDFFDALGFLRREGDGPDARYANTDETRTFLDKNAPEYVGVDWRDRREAEGRKDG